MMRNLLIGPCAEVSYLIRLKKKYAAFDLGVTLQSLPARCYGIN
jgi:hypothetical protein